MSIKNRLKRLEKLVKENTPSGLNEEEHRQFRFEKSKAMQKYFRKSYDLKKQGLSREEVDNLTKEELEGIKKVDDKYGIEPIKEESLSPEFRAILAEARKE